MEIQKSPLPVFAGDWHRLCDFDLRAMAGSGDWVTEIAAKAELLRRGKDYEKERLFVFLLPAPKPLRWPRRRKHKSP